MHSGTALSSEVVLRLTGSPLASQVASNAFVRFEYSLKIPVAVVGPVVLDAPAAGLNPIMFSVQNSEVAAAASQPATPTTGGRADDIRRETALRRSTRLLSGVSAHEPVYFGMGVRDGMNAKFQISLKYNPFDFGPVYMGFTQTSLWDLHSTSKPFRDSAYRPSLFYQNNSLFVSANGKSAFGFRRWHRTRVHGKGGDDSRSINIGFVRPRLEWTSMTM